MNCYICNIIVKTNDGWYCKLCARKKRKARKEHKWIVFGLRKRYCSKCGIVARDYGWYSEQYLSRNGKWEHFASVCAPSDTTCNKSSITITYTREKCSSPRSIDV